MVPNCCPITLLVWYSEQLYSLLKTEGIPINIFPVIGIWGTKYLKSHLINNMDHMRISGTEPMSVILSQIKYFEKLKIDSPQVQN